MKRINIPINESKSTTKDSDSIISIYENITIASLYDKYVKRIKLTREDLIVLYDIYHYFHNLSEDEEQIIMTIKVGRDSITDLTIIFECERDQIITRTDLLEEYPRRYVVLLNNFGNYMGDYRFKGVFQNLRYIRGNFHLSGPIDYDNNFPNLEVIGGYSFIGRLDDACGFESLKCFGKGVYWPSLKNASKLSDLEIIGGDANFLNLANAIGLNKLKYIYGNADFTSLRSSEGLENLRKITGQGYFTNVINPNYFANLEYTEGIYLPKCPDWQEQVKIMKKTKTR